MPAGDVDRAERVTRARPPLLAAGVVAAVALSSGAGLLAYFLSGLALPLGIGLALLCTAAACVGVLRRLDRRQRGVLASRVRAGLLAGVLATGAYDLTRLLTVRALGLDVNPFAALPIFGQLLTGQGPSAGSDVVGVVYHLCNGVGFGVAYTVVAARFGVLGGIAWALALEALMLTFYPGWLDIRAIGEFFSLSLLGHLAYGAVLGWTSRRLVAPRAEVAR